MSREHQQLEWKESWRDEHLKWVCAFANSEGGTLVHRDYMVSAPVQIRVYDDRLVLWNPAVLPEGWTAQTLREPHSSQPHNPEVANAFFRAGEIEAWGRGIARIFNACHQGGAPEPELRFDAGGVWMTFRFDEAYLRGVGSRRTGQVSGPVSDPVSDPVSPQVLQLLKLLETSPLSPSELMTSLGLKHRHSFRTRYLHPALSAELIELTIPEKPSSRLQRYRLTVRAHAYMQAVLNEPTSRGEIE